MVLTIVRGPYHGAAGLAARSVQRLAAARDALQAISKVKMGGRSVARSESEIAAAQPGGHARQLSYRNPPPNHDCENMDMPAVVTPSVNVTDMACVGHVVYTIAFPQLRGLTPTFAWLYIHMSVTRWDVTPRNACLWPQGSSAGAPTQMVIVRVAACCWMPACMQQSCISHGR